MAYNTRNALTGAAAGSVLGSTVLPGIGTIGGAWMGGLAGGFLKETSPDEINPYGTLNPEQIQLTKVLGPYLSSQIGTPNRYTGQLTAPVTGGESENVAQQARLGAMSEGALSSIIDPNFDKYSEDFKKYIGDPMHNDFLTNILPTQLENTPFASTEFGRRKTEALIGLQSTLGQLKFQGLEAAKNRQLEGVRAANELATTGAATQAIPREIKQAGLDREYADYVQGNQDKQRSIDQMLNFLGISTGTIRQGEDNMQTLLGTGLSLAKIYAALKGAGTTGGA